MSNAVITILDLIEARLRLMTTANGYSRTFTNVKRAGLEPWKSEDLPAVTYWTTKLDNSADEYGQHQRSFPLFIESHTKTHDDNFIDVGSELAADIITALNRSPLAPTVADDPSYDLGGAISDLVFEGYDLEIGQGQTPWCGVLVRITIKYTTEIFNMTSVGV